MHLEELIPIDEILKEMDLEDISEEQKLQLQENFTRLVEERTVALLLSSLDDDQKKELSVLNSDKEKLDYFAANGLELDEVFGIVLDQARVEFVKEAAYIKGYIDGKNSEQDAA